MPVTADVKRVSDTVLASGRAGLTEARKPFLAWVGAGDLALAKTRELPAQLKTLPEQVKGLPEQLKTVPGQLKALPEQATKLYSELISRGEALVGTVRRQSSTKAAANGAKTLKRETKAATTTARKTAQAAAEATVEAASHVG
jgi:uncharacterized phage infection (PIP) family protein YhgE